MSTPTQTSGPRAIFSEDGKTWRHNEGDGPVVKIVIGTPPRAIETAKPVELSRDVYEDFERHLPTVTHLHLWQVQGLTKLPALPPGLRSLDLRGCTHLTELPALPGTLETLVLDHCPVARLELPDGALPGLEDMSLRSWIGASDDIVNRLLQSAPSLRWFDVSGNDNLEAIREWPTALERIELNDGARLFDLPANWPPKLRRLGLRNARALSRLPDFQPESVIDYVDLAGTASLRSLPAFGKVPPRTLFLYGSGVDMDPSLLGESDQTNVAADVFADLGEARHGAVVDHEVKVILLGNGRCGKTSVVRRLCGQKFERLERSTHGIRLWTLKLPFRPVDEPETEATAHVHIWDFGGQHLYQNTHRPFLQNRAVFVICGTDAGKGADDAGDQEAQQRHDDEEDIQRSFAYWREQVEALGTDAQGERPPVIVLTTKADRPAVGSRWTESVASVPERERLAISARRPGKALAQLKLLLAERVAQLLGRRRERTLGRRPAAFKADLTRLQAANERVWRKAELQGERAAPKHAKLACDVARRMVQQYCPDGAYHDQPELLLRRLHRAGFLYWNETTLADVVILDQRWAIEGIYAVLNRASRGYGYLKETRGLFTPRDLAAWEWSHLRYRPQEQELFLGFMQSCGVAIKLLDRHETGDEPCFIAFGFLPDAGRVKYSAPRDAELRGTPLRNVESHVVIRLFEAVARRQGREFERWKWGLKCSDDAALGERRLGETLWAEWTPTSPEGVTGDLTIHIKTPNRWRSLYAALVREALAGYPGQDAGFLTTPDEWRVPADREEALVASGPSAGDDTPRLLPPLLRVSTSFSGDPSPANRSPVQPQTTRPAWKHAAFPAALRRALEVEARRDKGGYRVLDYQADEAQRIASLRELIAQLVKGDLLVVVLSRRYFESPYCMQELFEIAQKLEEKSRGTPPEWKAEVWKSEAALTDVYWLPDARNAARNQRWKDEVKASWEDSYSSFVNHVSRNHFRSFDRAIMAIRRAAQGHAYLNPDEKERIPDLGPCVAWFATSDAPEERQKVLAFLDSLIERDGNVLTPELLNNAAGLEAYAEKQADELAQRASRIQGILTAEERSGRLEDEIRRALSARDATGPETAIALFRAWLELNSAHREAFSVGGAMPPASLSEPIRRAWQLAAQKK